MTLLSFDLHIHSVASGHGTTETITDLAKAAAGSSLSMIGIADHGPKTPGSARESYFRSLSYAPRTRFGVEVRYGVECNILDAEGSLDLPDSVLSSLDYAIISFHLPTYRSLGQEANTRALISAMQHPNVKILGHPEDGAFPVDFDLLAKAAKDYGVFPEVNNASFRPDAFRRNTRENGALLLAACQRQQCMMILSSDSHGSSHIGDFSCSCAFLEEHKFPHSLICQASHLVIS